jgi:phosphoglycolate phosphatase
VSVTADPGPRWRAALFDLDGTLIDTRPGMQTALRAALRDVIGSDELCSDANLSLPLEAMIRSVAPAASSDVIGRVAIAYRAHYDAGNWKEARLYPGAVECLREVQEAGVRAFIVTNKRASAATRLIEHFGLAPYFEQIVGQPETATPVSKAELARSCVVSAGLDPASTVVVGDSDPDASMATSLDMTFIAFTAGAGPLSQTNAPRDRVEMGSLVDVGAFVAKGTLWRKS